MTRLPELAAVLGSRGPAELAAAAFLGDLAEIPRLLGNLILAAVKFEQQQRRLRQRQFRVGIARPHLRRIEQFNPGERNAGLNCQNGGLAGAAHGFERASGRRDDFGNPAQLDGQFADDPESSFGADEQMRQVVTGARFLCPRAGGDDFAIAAHHFERQHVVAHRAVTHRVGARRPRRGHSPQRRIGAWIDREEHALIAQVLIQRLAGDPGLNHAVEIFGMDLQHLVHVAQVDADAACRRVHLTLQ